MPQKVHHTFDRRVSESLFSSKQNIIQVRISLKEKELYADMVIQGFCGLLGVWGWERDGVSASVLTLVLELTTLLTLLHKKSVVWIM